MLDERTVDVARSVCTFVQTGHYFGRANRGDAWWESQGLVGYHWYLSDDRKSDTESLYTYAALVAEALGK